MPLQCVRSQQNQEQSFRILHQYVCCKSLGKHPWTENKRITMFYPTARVSITLSDKFGSFFYYTLSISRKCFELQIFFEPVLVLKCLLQSVKNEFLSQWQLTKSYSIYFFLPNQVLSNIFFSKIFKKNPEQIIKYTPKSFESVFKATKSLIKLRQQRFTAAIYQRQQLSAQNFYQRNKALFRLQYFYLIPPEMESSYCQPSQQHKESSLSIKRSSELSNSQNWAQGLWTQEEKVKYIAYIHFNRDLLNSRLQRRASKIFKQMSLFVKTRNPSQCRSQNQKVYRRFKTTRRIVASFKQEYGSDRFDSALRELMKDPLIKFHTQGDKSSGVNTSKSLEGSRESNTVCVQTESAGILVEMTQQEYESWRMFRMGGYGTAFAYQYSPCGFTQFYQ